MRTCKISIKATIVVINLQSNPVKYLGFNNFQRRFYYETKKIFFGNAPQKIMIVIVLSPSPLSLKGP